ncbi:unnamed protein product [Hymenolepis diminuta]|uniref:E2 ubiquitin-conjugating enzyme n=1 Tax=Hymenolepis diminuta TaxID=6216 RepID=A0A0R3SNQ5_HYMDI|nr:unnamed protein product [Hymenolepis diminuta]
MQELIELEKLNQDSLTNCMAGPVNGNLKHWHGTIIGPDGTPYAGGVFHLDIRFPTNYPFEPPKINFVNKIYHPNINSGRYICLDILKNRWTPSFSISSVLDDPNLDDPLVAEIAHMYIRNKQKYLKIAGNWTQKYASGTARQQERNLVEDCLLTYLM